MKANIAITGGTGFIGGHLIKRLTREGYHLRCLVRTTSDITFLKGPNIKPIYGDITEVFSLPDLLQEASVVFHLAGQVSVSRSIENPLSTFLANTMGTLNILEALRSAGRSDCLLIYISTDRVYGNPNTEVVSESDLTFPLEPYAASKLSAEHLCQIYSKLYSIPFTILRIANVYGPGQREGLLIPSIIKQIASGREYVRLGTSNVYRNFIYVEDVIEALCLAFEPRGRAENQIFNISERAANIGEIVNTLLGLSLKYLGRKLEVLYDPSLVRPSIVDTKNYTLDCSKARDILGWSPRYPLEKALEETFRLSLE